MAISVVKLTIVAVLGGIALFTGAIVLSLQVVLLQKRQLLHQRRLQQEKQKPQDTSQQQQQATLSSKQKSKSSSSQPRITAQSVQHSDPTTHVDLARNRHVDTGSSTVTAATAYWNQIALVLSDGDAVIPTATTTTTLLPVWDGSSSSSSRSTTTSHMGDDTSHMATTTTTTTTTTTRNVQHSKTNTTTNTATASRRSQRRNLSQADLLQALYQSAKLGHPDAQFYFANALATGIWPIGMDQAKVATTTTTTTTLTDSNDEDHVSMNDGWRLVVPDDIVVFTKSTAKHQGSVQDGDSNTKNEEEEDNDDDNDDDDEEEESLLSATTWKGSQRRRQLQQQFTKALVYWHMAAMGGNVEAAMAMAYRLETFFDQQQQQDHSSSCENILPYYEAAAHGIMDQLEASLHSRAKVTPPQDQHNLAEVYMHGGEAGKLHWNNRPDESPEALQFYHLRAIRKDSPDVDAAFTLAQYYHYGIRGVAQNLTTALFYYEIAANAGHWEAAGQAGKFYFWGLGMEAQQRDLLKANQYFHKGAPFGLDGCEERHSRSVLQKKKIVKKDMFGEDIPDVANEKVVVCDHPSVNGLGLVALFGIPFVVDVDRELALQYFILSRDMGNIDAAYNTAMMRLGWKTSWKRLDDIDANGQTIAPGTTTTTIPDTTNLAKDTALEFWRDVANDHEGKRLHRTSETGTMAAGPSQADYLMAMQDLQSAAQKGHIQARHRLAMLFASGVRGVTAQGVNFTAIARDCTKALKFYKQVVENGSPQLSQRLRKAYKQYMARETAPSLRNYLAAAETGSQLAQVNAAFLLERGECLDLSPTDCAKASVRLWKAAANQDSVEASLRVGDFYYYGRLRGKRHRIGPYAWAHHLVYPEKLVPIAARTLYDAGSKWLLPDNQTKCGIEGYESCEGKTRDVDDEKEEFVQGVIDRDLATAARYYRLAAERHKSARAHFNLGFMHEWGLGLKQDFPLAKRHYDLAAATNSLEADLAVTLALWAMHFHERIVKLQVWWKERHQTTLDKKTSMNIPQTVDISKNQPLPPPPSGAPRKTKTDVIFAHIFSWESLLIVLLTLIAIMLLQLRRTRR